MSTPSNELAPGTLLGDRYRIEQRIGQGGFGAVFQATQLNLGRAVAIKVLLPDLLDQGGLERFQREAALVQRLEHPNIVRLLDFGRAADGSPFLVFELLKGMTLESLIVRQHGLPPDRVARITSQILKALMEAHAHGIVHRDIKPANVFLCDFQGERDFVKLLDFGIAKGDGTAPLTRHGEAVGTPSYMAPEQLNGRGATIVSDLYSLGLLMSESLSGKPIFEGSSAVEIAREQVSEKPVPHPTEVLKSPLVGVVHRATQKAPERRFTSAAEMLQQLEAAMAQLGAAATPAGLSAGAMPAAMSAAYAPTGVVGGTPPPPGYLPISASTPQAAGPGFSKAPGYPAPGQNADGFVPANERASKGKASTFPWVLVVCLVAAAALLGIGLLVLVTRIRPIASPIATSGSGSNAAPGGTPPGSAASPSWVSRVLINVVESNVTGDATLDFVTFVANPTLQICAFDGVTFQSVWCIPVSNERFPTSAMVLAGAGRSIVYTDSTAVVRIFDAATGAERGTAKLTARALLLCTPSETPDKVWIKAEDKQGLLLDPATSQVSPARRPASCGLSKDEIDCRGASPPPTCLPEIRAPKSNAMRGHRVATEGAIGVSSGRKAPVTTVPMIMGFTLTPSGATTLVWERNVASIEGIGSTLGAHALDVQLVGGRAVATYDDAGGVSHLSAFQATSGQPLWDIPSPSYVYFKLTPTRLFVGRIGRLDVRDAATGKLLGGVGPT